MSVECLLGDYHVLYNGPKIPSDERRGVCIQQSAAIFHFSQENLRPRPNTNLGRAKKVSLTRFERTRVKWWKPYTEET